MSTLLWQYFFEHDVEKFRQVLAAASQNASSAHIKTSRATGLSTSPSPHLGASPNPSQKKRYAELRQGTFTAPGKSAKSISNTTLSRADLNWRDSKGVTLLHTIASSPRDTASEFAAALLEQPLLDLYIQDEESGWTALHRALYFGNVTIARALMDRDLQDSVTHLTSASTQGAGGLIKIKDKEGNSPFDVYGASISSRSIRGLNGAPLLEDLLDEEDEERAQGVTGDLESDEESPGLISMRSQVCGDEVFAFGSNKNFTLGFGDEDDRQFPERVNLTRPPNLLRRLYQEHTVKYTEYSGQTVHSTADGRLPALVEHKPIVIHDVQLSKLHSAILTGDPEANLYICGFGSGGRLGTGDEATRFAYVNVQNGPLMGKKIVDIALGQDHSIAISSSGETFTWGSNSFGQLGYALSTNTTGSKDEKPAQLLPRYVYGPLKRESVVGAAASRIHSIVFTATSLFTFGKNEGQLGIMDSDARSLAIQTVPRRVAAALFSSGISSVTAIDKATICLLQNHEVWVFANYGYTKMTFSADFAPNYYLQRANSTESRLRTVENLRGNQIAKIASGGDTICAMSTNGNIYTIQVAQRPALLANSGSTTNPSKIREALSPPQRVWSTKKGSMAVHDVGVGQDGSIIICAASGSVWRRVKRAKIKEASPANASKYKAKDFKFSRVPKLTGVKAVRSNAFGGFAAIRQDCDVLKTQVEVESPNLWSNLLPLLPIHGLGAEDLETENPTPRFWMPAQQNDVATIRRFVMSTESLEDDVASFLAEKSYTSTTIEELVIGTTISDTRIPVHEFILSGRSSVLRHALARFRMHYFFEIPETLSIEYDKSGKILVMFTGIDFITTLNFVLYLYTDSLIDVWHYAAKAPKLAYRYRQIRIELMKLAALLEMRKLEHAARMMTEPSKTLHADLQVAVHDAAYFESGDAKIQLDGQSIRAHSTLLCARCPFFEGLFRGRAAGRWLSSRREHLQDTHNSIKIDLSHVSPTTFRFVVQYLYSDADERMFDSVEAPDIDAFLDLVLDVMSVANELMLDRLSQCCQKTIGRYGETLDLSFCIS